MKIAVIGCGNMGGAIIARLRENDMEVACFDPDIEFRNQVAKLGADTARTTAAAVRDRDAIILSLPNSCVMKDVMDEIMPHVAPGTTILDTSTLDPRDIAGDGSFETNPWLFAFIDTPVSGGPAAVCRGSMAMLLAGDHGAIENLSPLTNILTEKAVVVGMSGAAHAAKIDSNMLCAANLMLVADALRICQAAGVALEGVLSGINMGSGRSGVSEINFPKWIMNGAFDSGFTMGLMPKDVRLALDLAQQTGARLDSFEGIADLWLNTTQDDILNSADFNAIAQCVSPKHGARHERRTCGYSRHANGGFRVGRACAKPDQRRVYRRHRG